MGDFQLILLSEVNRPARQARESDAFSLIPFPEHARAGMAPSVLPTDRDITPEDVADWFTPMQAIGFASLCVGVDGASKAVWQLLTGGMIQAVATSSSQMPKDRSPITKDKPSIIPRSIWNDLSETGTDLWNGGYARFWISRGYEQGTTYRYFGIKLNPAHVKANLPPPRPDLIADAAGSSSSTETPQPAPTPEIMNRGGRPRKEWWDDFWIEICRQIWIGDLKPDTQADLERAMFEWVENHRNAEVGETTIKAAARKLFKAWKLGSKT